MFKRKNVSVALAVTSVLLASAASVNAEVANGTATVTVQNAFGIASTTAIDFGTLRVTSDGSAANVATPAFTTLDVDGTQTAVDGNSGSADNVTMTVITEGTPGRVDVTGAAPFTNLTVTLADTADLFDETNTADANAIGGLNRVDLTTAGAAASAKFVMFVSADNTRIEGGLNDGEEYEVTSGVGNLRTDAAGAVGLTFGGVLAWNFAATESPADQQYSGNYSVTINY